MTGPQRYAYHAVAIDDRDTGPERDRDTLLGTKGEAVHSAVTIHVPGVTLRRNVYSALHDQIAASLGRHPDPSGRRLCGVEHVEDIQLWQAPHSGRRELAKVVRQLERQHRRPVVIVHAWQHLGPCPPASPPESGAAS